LISISVPGLLILCFRYSTGRVRAGYLREAEAVDGPLMNAITNCLAVVILVFVFLKTDRPVGGRFRRERVQSPLLGEDCRVL
jgi:hypothetical protein